MNLCDKNLKGSWEAGALILLPWIKKSRNYNFQLSVCLLQFMFVCNKKVINSLFVNVRNISFYGKVFDF